MSAFFFSLSTLNAFTSRSVRVEMRALHRNASFPRVKPAAAAVAQHSAIVCCDFMVFNKLFNMKSFITSSCLDGFGGFACSVVRRLVVVSKPPPPTRVPHALVCCFFFAPSPQLSRMHKPSFNWNRVGSVGDGGWWVARNLGRGNVFHALETLHPHTP